MKKIISLFIFGLLATVGLTFQANAMNLNPDVKNSELKKFDKFLDKHRTIESDLRTNPSLVDDSQYLASHRDLQNFLRKHPNISADLRSNPNYFMRRENRYEKKERHKKKHRRWFPRFRK